MKDKRNRHGAVGKSSSEQHFRKSAVLSYTRILPIRVWASFLDPYAYGLPVRVRAAHTSIAGNPCFAHMRISAHTCMHGHIASSLHACPCIL